MNALFIAVIIAVVGVAALIVFVAGRRTMRGTGQLPLIEVMRYRGAHLRDPLDEADARYQAHAIRACITCADRRLCDEQLRAGRAADSYAMCPNARYIECVRQGGLIFN